ncbi:MAG: response regulator [Gammaproteobacteria bacterium]|nr:response regulator [Gammaproteobacteria bacterium]MCP5416532.1 response regulator [Chromatiaceae bacterium]
MNPNAHQSASPLGDYLSTLWHSIRSQQNSEVEQGIVRVVIIALILLYLNLMQHSVSTEIWILQSGILLFSLHLLFGLCVLVSFLFRPQRSNVRIVLGIVADISSFSMAMITTGEIGAPWWAGCLWITFGNGFRFGERYLYFSATLSVIGFSAALLLNEFWRNNIPIGIGLMVAMLVLPGYVAVLIKRLRTEQKRAEEASQAKSEFLARMSHEIRTPLNGIIGTGDLLKTCKLNTEEREYADIIYASGQTLLKLIEDILDISKIEAGKLELEHIDFDLHSLINTTLRMFSAEAESKRLHLSSHIGLETPYRLVGDPHHLRQVLINLIGNAIKFTEKGSVELRCHTIRTTEHRSLIRFEVVDTGIGISAEAQARIFENFSQADESTTRRFGGTGLGTAIARQLVELMGGRIGLQSTPAIGSTFWFDIEFQHQEQLVKEEEIQQLQTCHVMRLCSQPGSNTDISHTLNGWGVPFKDVGNTREALRLLIRSTNGVNPYEVIILDDVPYIPEIRNFLVSLSRELALPNITILIVQSEQTGSLINDLGEIGNTVYSLRKPFDKALLFNALHASNISNYREEGIISLSEHFTRNRSIQRPLKILVAEDNSVNRIVTGRILEHAGHQHHLVENGHQVLDALEKEHYDLVIIDMQMPELGGVDTFRMYCFAHASDDNPVPFIMLTANATVSARHECQEAGIKYFLTKPVSSSKLLQTIALATDNRLGTMSAVDTADTTAEEEFPVVDPGVLSQLRELAPNTEFLYRLYDNFAADSKEVLIGLQSALERSDILRWRALAHAIKGSSMNLGLMELSTLATDLEHIPDTLFSNEAAAKLNTLRSSTERAKARLAELLEYHQPAVH